MKDVQERVNNAMVTLEQLIIMVGFPDKDRMALFTQIKNMNLAERSHVYDKCWELLQKDFFNKLQEIQEKITEAAYAGKNKDPGKDLQAAIGLLVGEYIKKLGAVDSNILKNKERLGDMYDEILQRMLKE